jgi:hypothetical protein
MRVRMADERAVHIEQCDPAEIAVHDTQSSRHLSLQSGVGLPGNEPPLDFIEKDREDQAENRDVQQADIYGVDRRNLPPNHKADAVIGATISEDCNPDEARPRDLKRSLRDVRSTVPDRTNGRIGRVSFAGFAAGSMRYQVSSNELKFEVYGPSDSIWNEGDEVCVDFATDAASIFES